MPFRLFLLLSSAARHLVAEHTLTGAHATAYGAALALGGAKDPATRRTGRKLARAAFPTDD